jgi:hypothetical protein
MAGRFILAGSHKGKHQSIGGPGGIKPIGLDKVNRFELKIELWGPLFIGVGPWQGKAAGIIPNEHVERRGDLVQHRHIALGEAGEPLIREVVMTRIVSCSRTHPISPSFFPISFIYLRKREVGPERVRNLTSVARLVLILLG